MPGGGRDRRDEAEFRRRELDLLRRGERGRLREMALGALLIALFVAIIFWLISQSPPPPPKDNDTRLEPRPAPALATSKPC